MSKNEKIKKNNKKIVVKEKLFCPVCGSAAIRPTKNKYRCLNCKALFSKPEKTKIELRETPRYIG